MLSEINDVYSVADYENIRQLAKKVKTNDYQAIRLAATLMSLSVPKEGCVFVPVPNHQGYATYTLKLAQLIAKKTNGFVADVLTTLPREMVYSQKKNEMAVDNINLGINVNIPLNYKEQLRQETIFLVDNVVDSATTYKQCQLALQNELGVTPDILTIGTVLSPKKLVHNTTNHIYDFKSLNVTDDMDFYRQWLRKYRRRQKK